MRISVPLLILCAAITGCTTSSDPALVDIISVTSTPSSAAVRVNGAAVGRTPTTVTLERNSNYELVVGKGGYSPETTYLKPTLRTSDNGSLDFGFPSKVNITLTKLPGDGEVAIPEGDEAEFKGLIKKANGESAEATSSLRADIDTVVAAAEKVKAAIVAREVASKAKLDATTKVLDEVRAISAKGTDAEIDAKVTAAEANLKGALADRDSGASAAAADALAKLEQRRVALEAKLETTTAKELAQQVAATKAEVAATLAASDAKIAQAQAALTAAEASRTKANNGKPTAEWIAELEKQIKDEAASLANAKQNSEDILKSLASRNEELTKIANYGVQIAKDEAAKQLASIQQALEEQKTAVGKAVQERDEVKTAADKSLAEANTAAAKVLAEANANADKALGVAKEAATKDMVELTKQLDQAKADSKADAAAAAEKALAAANEKLASMEKAISAAKADADKASAEAKDAADRAVAAANKALAEAKDTAAAEKVADKSAAEKALADARLDAEAKLAEAEKVAKEAIAESKRRVYAERNTRVALLELRARTKQISEGEYKAQLAAVLKEIAQ